MNVTTKRLGALKHPKKNVRIHSEQQIRELKRSIEKFGQTRAIVVDEDDTILIGNGLYEAMVSLGYQEATVYVGELLVLTPQDIDFDNKVIRITKSYQRLEGKDVITDPKTPKSKRNVSMPDFLCEELKDYIGRLYGILPTDRIFHLTKSFLHHEMTRGRLLCQDVVVQGNPRVYKALRNELAAVLTELQRIEAGGSVDNELLDTIELIAVILGGLKGEGEDGE